MTLNNHVKTSFVKSAFQILCCIAMIAGDLKMAGEFLLVAAILGVIEELF